MTQKTTGALDWTGAQRGVIGAGLVDGGCVAEILADTRPEDFSGELRSFYEAFAKLSAEGKPIDKVTVVSLLGPEYVDLAVELARQTPTAANVSAYIAICREQSRLALLRQCGWQMNSAPTLEEARAALDRAAGVSLESGRKIAWTAGECAEEWFDRLNRGESPVYIRTGIGALDQRIRTVAGDYVIIAGYTSHGKSALGLQCAWAISRQRRVGYFAYEGSRAQWTNRLIAYRSKVPLDRVQDQKLTDDEVQRCTRALGEIHDRALYYEAAAGMTVDDIRAETLRQRYEVIFVDYLQKIPGSKTERSWGRVQEVSGVSSGLQTMGMRYGVTVYAMSQLSRPQKQDSDYLPLPGLSDLRESGQIEQDADAVVFVHAPFKREHPKFRILDLAKCRNGTLYSYYADFQGDVQTFAEPSPVAASEYRRLMNAVRLDKGRGKGRGFVPGKAGGGFGKLTDTAPEDNPFAQESLPL